MSEENFQAIIDNSPFIAWIHNMSKNQLKYLNNRIQEMNLGHEMRYIMAIYDNQGLSQDDLVNIFGQSKASIAKAVKKLENQNYITRQINPDNRRKYMLKTTPLADELVPKIRQISKDWEKEVGITPEDEELRKRIKEIAINGMRLVE